MAVFEGEANFFKSTFAKHAVFSGTIFSKTAQFDVCKFQDACNFSNIRAFGGFFFNSSEFSKPANFNDARFSDRVEFQSAIINADITLSNCSFFGWVKYNKSQIDGVLSFEKSFFHEHSPVFDEAKLTEGSHINLKDALTVKKEPVVISGLKKEKN
jgi:hypothetical protein